MYGICGCSTVCMFVCLFVFSTFGFKKIDVKNNGVVYLLFYFY